MAHRDPEQAREYQRRYREEHREERREAQRRWRANPENRARANESKRKSREDPEVLARKREAERERWRRIADDPVRKQQHDERKRQYAAANREKIRAARARYRETHLEQMRASTRRSGPKVRHGSDYLEVFAAMWQAQGGRCYLCGDDLIAGQAFIDHDHRCCPPARSCQYCRRGLTCPNCNSLVGFARDDPARLRRIAGNLEVALAVVTLRLAGRDVQEALAFDQAAAAAVDAIPAPARLRAVSGGTAGELR